MQIKYTFWSYDNEFTGILMDVMNVEHATKLIIDELQLTKPSIDTEIRWTDNQQYFVIFHYPDSCNWQCSIYVNIDTLLCVGDDYYRLQSFRTDNFINEMAH